MNIRKTCFMEKYRKLSQNYHQMSTLSVSPMIVLPQHDKTSKMTGAPSEESDQPGHLPSLISFCCSHTERLGAELTIKRTRKTLVRLDWANAQIVLSLPWANRSLCWFCRVLAHFLPLLSHLCVPDTVFFIIK